MLVRKAPPLADPGDADEADGHSPAGTFQKCRLNLTI
jgi:hypothetical protein